MEQNISFDLERSIDKWFNNIKVEPTITDSDAEELKSHLLDQIDDLKRTGLDDKEAFWVASNRLSLSEELAEDYQQSNNHLIQMKKSLLILGGVLVFFFLFYFIETFSKVLFIAVHYFSDSNENLAIAWFERFLVSSHFFVLIILVSVYLFDGLTIRIIEKIKLRPKHTIFIVTIMFILELLGIEAHATVKSKLSDNYFLIGKFIHDDIYFSISFPLLMCIGFILIYFKYYNKSKK